MAAKSKVYFHSPFCPTDFQHEGNRALLLLFILKAALSPPVEKEAAPELLPFDWAQEPTHAQKLTEHLSLLPAAFPHLANLVPNLCVHAHDAAFISLLEPFLLELQDNENLLLFLIQHQNKLALKPVLDKISPEGLHVLQEKIVTRFRKRGYPFSRWMQTPRRSY